MIEKNIHVAYMIIRFGIPYGDFNSRISQFYSNRVQDIELVLSKKLTNKNEILDTIGFMIAVVIEFAKDNEIETILGCTLQEAFEIIDSIKNIYKDRI